MIKTILSTVACSLALASLAQESIQTPLEEVLRGAEMRRQEYVDTFKDLTAVETRVTEIIGKDGRTEKRRTVVSDFLVYRSPPRYGAVSEYRIAREVDGKPVSNSTEDAIKVLKKLASARTLEQQYGRLRDANMKYMLKYLAWGFTLNPVGAVRKDLQPAFEFAILGRERAAGRDLIVLGYHPKELRSVEARGLFRSFRQPRAGSRGRAWLDAGDWRITRWEDETTVSDHEIATPVVSFRTEAEYGSSAYGILTPKTVVVSFFEKGDDRKASQPVRLAARMTCTYQDFKRFDVSTSTTIR